MNCNLNFKLFFQELWGEWGVCTGIGLESLCLLEGVFYVQCTIFTMQNDFLSFNKKHERGVSYSPIPKHHNENSLYVAITIFSQNLLCSIQIKHC